MRTRIVVLTVAALLVLVGAAGVQVGSAEKPVLITSIGQSAEAAMVRQLAIRGKIPHVLEPLADAGSLIGNDRLPKYSALVAVVGGSAKGLGAAGINKEQEADRAIALLERARELKLKIVVMHIGGEARRGELSDPFIRMVLPFASSVIVVASGDRDGLFEAVLKGKDIPFTKVERIAETLEPLKRALGIPD